MPFTEAPAQSSLGARPVADPPADHVIPILPQAGKETLFVVSVYDDQLLQASKFHPPAFLEHPRGNLRPGAVAQMDRAEVS